MRAKEYFEQWKESPPVAEDLEDIVSCANEFLVLFFEELSELCKSRNIGREESVRSAIFELDDKWRVFTGFVNADYNKKVLNADAFMETLKLTDANFYKKVMVK